MKDIAFAVVLVLASAATAFALDPPSVRTAAATFMAGMLADEASTVFALKAKNKLGNTLLVEKDPLVGWMQQRPVAMAVVDAAVEASIAVVIAKAAGPRHPKIVKAIFYGEAALRFFLAARNVKRGIHQIHSY